MYSDCTGEPPGELICNATAFGLPCVKAFLIFSSSASSVSPCLTKPNSPITPDSRNMLTVGPFFFSFLGHDRKGF